MGPTGTAFPAAPISTRRKKGSAQKLRPTRNAAHSNLSELEREWQRLHSDQNRATLRRLVACGERGECDGLKLASQ